MTIAFTADQLEKRHAIFSVVENFRCLTDIQALKFNSLFRLAICYLVLCCFPRSTRNSAEPVKRLWRTLVHQESIKELFIQNIFKREMASNEEVSPFLISLLFPISFSFSSFLAFFPPSSLLLRVRCLFRAAVIGNFATFWAFNREQRLIEQICFILLLASFPT